MALGAVEMSDTGAAHLELSDFVGREEAEREIETLIEPDKTDSDEDEDGEEDLHEDGKKGNTIEVGDAPQALAKDGRDADAVENT